MLGPLMRAMHKSVILLIFVVLAAACGQAAAPMPDATPTPKAMEAFTPTPGPTPTVAASPAPGLGPSELKYHLISYFGGVFYCDPDFYPVARQGQEEQRAR